MELQQFVTETLKQVISGVADAQAHAAANRGEVNPGGIVKDMDRIEFDVAVTTQDATSTKGGAGVFVGAVGIGARAQADTGNQVVSRIKFSILVRLPEHVQQK